MSFRFLFANDSGNNVISKPYTIEQIIQKSIDDIWEELEECNCQPVGETNVIECACGDRYADYSFKEVLELTPIVTTESVPIPSQSASGETVEHACDRIYSSKCSDTDSWFSLGYNVGFEDGAQWQQTKSIMHTVEIINKMKSLSTSKEQHYFANELIIQLNNG